MTASDFQASLIRIRPATVAAAIAIASICGGVAGYSLAPSRGASDQAGRPAAVAPGAGTVVAPGTAAVAAGPVAAPRPGSVAVTSGVRLVPESIAFLTHPQRSATAAPVQLVQAATGTEMDHLRSASSAASSGQTDQPPGPESRGTTANAGPTSGSAGSLTQSVPSAPAAQPGHRP